MNDVIEIYLLGEIKDAGEYKDQLSMIRNASRGQIVKIFINSSGGNAETALQFQSVIRESKAIVIGSIEGFCLSAASMIFLVCDDHMVSSNSVMLIHDWSSAMSGNSGEIHQQTKFFREWSKNLLSETYNGFLTEREINNISNNNNNLWIGYNEIMNRLKDMCGVRSKQKPTLDYVGELSGKVITFKGNNKIKSFCYNDNKEWDLIWETSSDTAKSLAENNQIFELKGNNGLCWVLDDSQWIFDFSQNRPESYNSLGD